jgi:hypothetical protein
VDSPGVKEFTEALFMSSGINALFQKIGLSLAAFFSLLSLLPAVALAAQVTVAWDPNVPTPDGYHLYQRMEGQTYDYDQPVWTGTDNTATIYDLTDNQRYFFVVRAYTGLDESADSNEISFLSEQSSPPPVTTYSISVDAGENGSISPDQTMAINTGEEQTFQITPNTGYHISDVHVDGSSVGAVSSYTFSQVSANHTIQAEFAMDHYTIAASAGANGTISPNGNISIEYGSGQTFSFTADAGYHVSDVKVDGLSKGSLTSYAFSQIAADHSISVAFSQDTYTIPQAGEVTLAWDPNDPAPNFYCLYLRTEGQVYDYTQPCWSGTGTSTTVYNLSYDMTYHFVVRAQIGSTQSADSNEISFRLASPVSGTHTITASAGQHGSISPSGTTEVNPEAAQTYTITPDTGYHVSDVRVDGVSIGMVSSYAFTNVSADHTITASFAIDTYTLTASAGANGGIAPSGATHVDRGAAQTYTITPDVGYHVSDVSVDGVSIGAESSYTFSDITANHTIGVAFEADTFIISTTAGANGSVAPANGATVAYNGSQTFTLAPNEGYHIEDVQVDGQSVGVMRTYTFSKVTVDHTLSVLFSETTPVKLWIEAEDGNLQWPMEIADDENASAGGYVWVPEGTGSYGTVSESAGFAEYAFEVPESGEYVIWGREVSNDSASDSFFVSIDGQPDIVWHTRPGGEDQWTWDGVSLRVAEAPDYASAAERFQLSAGPHTLRISQREDGTKLDRLLITNQTDITDPEPETVLEAMEFGEIQINHTWFRVYFEKPFDKPVVVAGPISLNGDDPAVIRIRNVDSTGFEIRIQEWGYLDDVHTVETVSYLVMEAGRHTLDDGTRIEAATVVTGAASSFQTVAFSEGFNVVPVVLSTLTSFNDADTVTGRMKRVTTDGFSYRMQEQESNTQDHMQETLSYIAWEPSSGEMGDTSFRVGRTVDAVKHKDYSLLFDSPLASSPIFLADMQTTDGGDTANVRYRKKAGDAVDVLIDEEQSRDSETSHTTEVLGYVALTR